MLAIFDWDGTLCDSLARIERCFAAAAREQGLAVPGSQAIGDQIGLALEQAFINLYPHADDSRRRGLLASYRRYFLDFDLEPSPMPLFPGVRDGLHQLADAGWQLSIATGKSRVGLDRSMGELDLDGLFVATRCADESRPKPGPDLVFDLLAMTGKQADDAVVIGDSVHDLAMANAAGVRALGTTWGVHDATRQAPLNPLAILDSFDEVVECLTTMLPRATGSALRQT